MQTWTCCLRFCCSSSNRSMSEWRATVSSLSSSSFPTPNQKEQSLHSRLKINIVINNYAKWNLIKIFFFLKCGVNNSNLLVLELPGHSCQTEQKSKPVLTPPPRNIVNPIFKWNIFTLWLNHSFQFHATISLKERLKNIETTSQNQNVSF